MAGIARPCFVLLERFDKVKVKKRLKKRRKEEKRKDKGKRKIEIIRLSDSEEDDCEKKQVKFVDLIDDKSVEESDGESRKRKKNDDEDSDDGLDDEDYDVLEENLGVKVQRKRYKRLKKVEDSDEEQEQEICDEKEAIANQLFSNDLGSNDGDKGSERSHHSNKADAEKYDEEGSEEESDDDNFIVNDIVKPSTNIWKERSNNITDSAIKEAYDTFRVDLDYADDFEEEEEEQDEYTDEEEYINKSKKAKKETKREVKKKSIFEIYDRSELKGYYLTAHDNEIRTKDIPERMQLRTVPITSATGEELAEEAQWIYHQVFENKFISMQGTILNEEGKEQTPKGPQTVAKIQKALDLMRNQHFEVPFIFFYRKEYILPELNDINDLWKIYKFDARWGQFRQRKANLLMKFQKIKCTQEDYINQDPDGPLPDNVRSIEEEDINHLKAVQTMNELDDYSKQTVRSGPYNVCCKAGLDKLAKKFGLSPQQFAKNLSEWYQVHEVAQEAAEPSVVAAKYVGAQFKTVDEVLRGTKFVVAFQLAREPSIRNTIRKMYREKALISVEPTKRGKKVIDEHHYIYSMKYLKDKPVIEFVGDQYLKLVMAQEEKLITINFSDEIGYPCEFNVDKIKYLYFRDEDGSKSVKDWNELRLDSVEMALTKMIIPDMKKELHLLLLGEAKDCVMRSCVSKMRDWIKFGPYNCDYSTEIYEEWDTSNGLRVMGIAYVPDISQAAFACIVQPDGSCTSYLKLSNLLKKLHGINASDTTMKEADMRMIRNFILSKKPHVIAIGGESTEAVMIADDVKEVVNDLLADDKIPDIKVEIVENDFARVFANSHQGTSEFEKFPDFLRQAISLARRLQDPLVEFSQLCNVDNEILCLNFHSLQKQLCREDLLENIYLEFVNRLNEVGVDLNKIARRAHAANLVQFICGLGPRKGRSLIKSLKQSNHRLENRNQLATVCHLGPKVFVNCAAFIKIDPNNLDDSTETEIEILDATRIHPHTYGLAKKIAVDALEYKDANAAAAVEEIADSPEKLEELDLDAFAEELEQRGCGNKSITLNDIKSELIDRYKDLRTPYQKPTQEELLFMLTKETPETFCVGKLIEATITSIHYQKTKVDQLVEDEQPHPVRHEETGLWQCPLCRKGGFMELPEVWTHLDSDACPGKAIGIRLRIDNGLFGYIKISNLSDEPIVDLAERICNGNRIQCRVIQIEVDRFSAEVTSKKSDLVDEKHEWRPKRDPHYDTEAEEKEKSAEGVKKLKPQGPYVARTVLHPSFYNVTYTQAEVMMQTMMRGEAIIRPSSKGDDHLAITWKVTDDIYQHLDIHEKGKEHRQSLGQSLWIGNEEFEDLDEIFSRYINPMAGYAAELLDFKYYKAKVMGAKDRAEQVLRVQKKTNPNVTHYIISASKTYPGNFLLSYLPNSKCCHEYINVSHNGFKYRDNYFCTVSDLFFWFKNHFMESVPDNGSSVSL